MKSIIKIFLSIGLILVFFSCSEVKKQVAIDDLVGKYFGSPKIVLKWSELNIGIEDAITESKEKEVLLIFKNDADELILDLNDGMKVKLNNINMANNGATFNIPSQEIKIIADGDESNGIISGLNECTLGESRCDGLYDSEKGKLSFSFSGTIKFIQDGIEYNVPIAAGYSDYIKVGK